ncbi:MAG: glycosyltransferase family 1 protein [bacterium]
MRFLIVVPSIEDANSRGIQRVLFNVLSRVSETDNEVFLLIGAHDIQVSQLDQKLNDRVQKTFIRYYLKDGRVRIFNTSKFRIIKKIIKGLIKGATLVKNDKDLDYPTLTVLHYTDYVVIQPYIYQFLTRNLSVYFDFLLNRIISKYKIDVVLTGEPQNIKLSAKNKSRGVKLVQTVLDFLQFEGMDLEPNGFLVNFSIALLAALKNSDQLITISKDTAAKIKEIAPAAKTHVVYSYPVFFNSKYSVDFESKILQKFNVIPQKYFFFVSAVELRKNVIGLLNGYSMIANAVNIPLVVAGSKGFGYKKIVETFKRLPKEVKERVKFPGYINDLEKMVLLKNATAFVWPTKGEGLGLPIMEALALNTPIVASRIPTIVEIAGDAIHYIDDMHNEAEIGLRMLEIVSDHKLRNKLLQRYPQYVKQWTKENFDQRVDQLLTAIQK